MHMKVKNLEKPQKKETNLKVRFKHTFYLVAGHLRLMK